MGSSGRGSSSLQPFVARAWIMLVRREKEPLDLDARKKIFEHVREYPGLHLSEIARGVDMDTNHTKYHLEVLERHDLISSRKEEGYWRFYPREDSELGPREVLDPEEKEWLSLLRRRVPLQATLVLLDRDQAASGEIADALEVAPSTFHYHANKMEEVDLVESKKQGRKRIYALSDPERVAELVVRYEPPDELVKGFLEAWEEIEFP